MKFIGLVAAFSAANIGHSQVTVSNLSFTSGVSLNFTVTSTTGVSFTTDASQSSFQLESVTLKLKSGEGSPGPFIARIFSDNSGYPGTAIETLSGATTPLAEGNYTYTSTGITLASNATYWVVASIGSEPPGDGRYAWWGTSNLTETNTAGSNWSIGDFIAISSNGGASWGSYDSNAFQFSVTASAAAVPEPSTYAAIFGVCALGFVAYRRHRLKHAA